jgi:hypothetical protein
MALLCPKDTPFHLGVSTGKVRLSMDVSNLWIIVLLGLVLFGGEIRFNGAVRWLRRQPGRRELGDGGRKSVDE